ncbi:MAG: class I SAM-dependent methyltransferase [Planctomycetota bacterium]|nr:class I SAM-dependent methyltransferase [Planctomycetota bacterium]
MQYQFTDTDLATQRLEYLAGVYAQSSREFILGAVRDRPPLVLDLGCGPGYTTHLLAECTSNCLVVGLDNSERFLSVAKEGETDRVSFCLHDVTSVPFPVRPASLLFCRYLLTHLEKPLRVVEKWGTQLQRHGLLLMEEVEWIRTGNGVFAAYLKIVEAMLAAQSTCLYAGPVLDGLAHTNELKRRSSRVKRLPVLNHQAATMFHLNIQSWKHQSFIRENYDGESISELERDLKALSVNEGSAGEIEWGLRQLVFERL